MEIDKKYALLDTDFLYKSHLARNAKNHTLFVSAIMITLSFLAFSIKFHCGCRMHR